MLLLLKDIFCIDHCRCVNMKDVDQEDRRKFSIERSKFVHDPETFYRQPVSIIISNGGFPTKSENGEDIEFTIAKPSSGTHETVNYDAWREHMTNRLCEDVDICCAERMAVRWAGTKDDEVHEVRLCGNYVPHDMAEKFFLFLSSCTQMVDVCDEESV